MRQPGEREAKEFLAESQFIWHQKFDLCPGVETPGVNAMPWLLESFGFPYATGIAMLQLGRAQALLGDLEQGIAHIETAAATFDEVNVPMASLEARARLAEVLAAAGRTVPALEALATARTHDEALGESPMTAIIDRVEVTLASRDDPDTARTLLGPAMERARRLGASYDLLVLLTLAERLGAGSGDSEADAISRDLGVVRLVVLPDD